VPPQSPPDTPPSPRRPLHDHCWKRPSPQLRAGQFHSRGELLPKTRVAKTIRRCCARELEGQRWAAVRRSQGLQEERNSRLLVALRGGFLHDIS
jgi:hypothetical protein